MKLRSVDLRRAAALALASIWLSSAAAADERGRALFEPCRACHALDPAGQGLAGPNLAGLIGRKVGGDPAFDYSPVLRQAGREGRTWDAAALDKFLADPEDAYPGLWMSMRGIADPPERAALSRFLADPASR